MMIDAEDRSTGQVIRREWFLQVMALAHGAKNADLGGAVFVGDGPSNDPVENPINLSPDALVPLAECYRDANGGSDPLWLHDMGGISLEDAKLEGANLCGARLQSGNLWGADLRGANLRGADLQGASLRGSQLQGADLGGTSLRWTELDGAELQEAQVAAAKLNGASLLGAHLEGLDMYEVSSLDGASWYGAFLDHTRIKRDSLGVRIGDEIEADEMWVSEAEDKHWKGDAYHRVKEAYLLLKSNFNQIGRYEDASWAYVKEQQMEKMAFHWEWQSRLRLGHLEFGRLHVGPVRLGGWWWRFPRWFEPGFWGAFSRWLRNWAYELLTGYGEHPWRPALWALLVVGAFTAVYAGAGNIAPDFAGDPAVAQGSHHPLDALTHSIAAFATIGFNALEPLGWGARLLTAVESALGIGLFALFIFTIGNRMSRG